MFDLSSECGLLKEWKRNRKQMAEDKISKLPDALLCQILMCLPTKDVVRTSALSTRWKDLWRWVPQLDLDAAEFVNYDAFVSFCSRFLHYTDDMCIHKLKINVAEGEHDSSFVTSWIETVVRRRIQYIDVQYTVGDEFVQMPPSLLFCEHLVDLRLHFVAMNGFEFVSLPRLKVMHLTGVVFPYESAADMLISSCPILEELVFYRNLVDNVKVLRVRSQTLKIFSLDFEEFECSEEWGLVVDAPSLEYFRIHDLYSTSFTINNLGPFAKVDINVNLDVDYRLDPNDLARRNVIKKFLTGFVKVRDMMLCRYTLEDFHYFSKLHPLPQFGNLASFHTVISISKLGMLQTFLEISPNLKSLKLELVQADRESINVPEAERLSLTSVPRCLVTSLEQIEMITPIKGDVTEMKLMRYFMENSLLLKKLIVRVDSTRKRKAFGVFKKLLRIPRCSTSCEVVVL